MTEAKRAVRDTEALKQTLLGQMQQEMEEFAGRIAGLFRGLLDRGDPKGSENAFVEALHAFGSALMVRGLEEIDAEVAERQKKRGTV